jgi:hypothetical protein
VAMKLDFHSSGQLSAITRLRHFCGPLSVFGFV